MEHLNNQQHFKLFFVTRQMLTVQTTLSLFPEPLPLTRIVKLNSKRASVRKVLPTLVLPIAHFSSTKPTSANNLGILVCKINN